MDRTEFWGLIEAAKSLPEAERMSWIRRDLSQRPEEDIVDFELIFQKLRQEAYDSLLWGAAYVMMGGCSDDSFDYFRGWLIAQGETVYQQALGNPDTLEAYIPSYYEEEGLAPELEEIFSLAASAYTLKQTGTGTYDAQLADQFLTKVEARQPRAYTLSTPRITLDWEDGEDLKERLPRLWARFGEHPL